MDYKEAYSYEGHGGVGSFGMKVLVAVDRPINENDKRVLSRKIDEIQNAIMAETIRVDAKTIERVKKDRAEILALFSDPIYVEEIPNGYGPDDPWYRNFPWYQVTTKIGRIKIGWRKRVLVIDWSDTRVTAKAETLFAAETVPGTTDTAVTMHDRLIHAWDYDRAKRYITKLLEQA